MKDKQIGWTARYSFFFEDDKQPNNWAKDTEKQEGLGIRMFNHFKKLGTTFSDTIHWYNVMFYDVGLDKINNPPSADGRKLAHYEVVYKNIE